MSIKCVFDKGKHKVVEIFTIRTAHGIISTKKTNQCRKYTTGKQSKGANPYREENRFDNFFKMIWIDCTLNEAANP